MPDEPKPKRPEVRCHPSERIYNLLKKSAASESRKIGPQAVILLSEALKARKEAK